MLHLTITNVSALTFLAVFAAGLVTSLTPCVYPLIPIVVGFLGTRTGSVTQRVISSLAYVLGLSLVYSALGMLAALTGSLFGSWTTNPWVYLVFGIFIMTMGGNMMEWYTIPFLQGQGIGGQIKPSRFWGPLLVGASSGLVASPCTAPVLATLLMYVASTKAVFSGAALMFTFSLGMCSILMVIGVAAGLPGLLPKSGNWMVVLKRILAAMLLAAGIYFIFKAGTLA